MNNLKSVSRSQLQVIIWSLIGVIVFLPLLIPSQKLEYVQFVCLGLLIFVQYKLGNQSKLIMGIFSFAYLVLGLFWALGR